MLCMPVFYYRSYIIVFVLHSEKLDVFFFIVMLKIEKSPCEESGTCGYWPIRNQELQGFVAYMNFYLQLKASALRKAQKQNQ